VAQHYLTCVCNVILLLNGLTLILTLSCGLWVSVRVTGVPIPAISAGYEPLYGLRASLRATNVSARDELLYAWLASLSVGYGRLCGRRTTLRATGVSAGYGRLCARRASIRVAGIALYRLQLRICQYRNSDARLYGWLASLSLRTTVADLPVPQIWRASSSLQLIVGACLSRCLPCLQCSVLLCLFC
jgi:hypothetical protein